MNADMENQLMNDRLTDLSLLTQPAATMNEIKIDSLNKRDEIVIHTGNSQYSFLLTDTARLRGLLTGGQLGEELVEADLLAVGDDDGFHLRYILSAIGKGMRIIFYIPAGERNLVTSHITTLFLVKSRD